ncbi:hypothetical protein [Candidatus Frankia alpina]|uniref:hypothetical protein n=1 Tax=Candidatus Frankia alpina TaxID=2699483 RepID=UPI0026A75873
MRNVLALGLRLGVPMWVAPIVVPAVDLSVVALFGSRQLAVNGGPAEVLRSARRLSTSGRGHAAGAPSAA